MTAPLIEEWSTIGLTVPSHAEKHLTMHQFMYSTTADDPTSHGLPVPDRHGSHQHDEHPSVQVEPRVRIPIYPSTLRDPVRVTVSRLS